MLQHDPRRHHKRRVIQQQRRHPVDRGLTRTSREHDQHIMTGHHLFHRLQLLVAQLRPAKGLGGHPPKLITRRP
jgi:hypothetical protein